MGSATNLCLLQYSFDLALSRLEGGSRLADTTDRLHQLYCELQDGRISPPIQSQLLIIARTISNSSGQGNNVAASTALASLCAQHWEEHKHWLMGMKRLLSTQ